MILRHGAVVFVTMFGLLCTVGEGRADPPVIPAWDSAAAPGFYGSVGFRYESFGLSQFDTPAQTPGTGISFTEFHPRVNTFGPTAAIGYALGDNVLPSWTGHRPRIEVSGWWLQGSTRDTASATDSSGSATSLQGGYFCCSPFPLTQDAQLHETQHDYQIGLRVSSDYSIAENWTVSPTLNVFGGHTESYYKLTTQVSNPMFSPSFFATRENEDIRTTRIGMALGGTITRKITPSLSFHIGGELGPVFKRTHYSGDDCFSNTFAMTTTCDGSLYSTTASDTDNAVAFVGGAHTGLTYMIGKNIALSLVGGVDYDSKVPGIRQPTPDNLSPAIIRYDGATNFYAVLRGVIPF